MEMKTYEVLTDNFPRRAPAGKGARLTLHEIQAKYSVLSGDLKEVPAPAETPPAKPKGKGSAGDNADNGEGEGA